MILEHKNKSGFQSQKDDLPEFYDQEATFDNYKYNDYRIKHEEHNPYLQQNFKCQFKSLYHKKLEKFNKNWFILI